jgi:hypothetical protein
MAAFKSNWHMARLWLAATGVCLVGPALTASATVVDDFSVGPIIVTGPATQTQTGLDSAHVPGGSRSFSVGQFGSGSVVEIDPPVGLKFSSSGRGYFDLVYDFTTGGHGIDLTQGGHDRFRLILGNVAITSFTPLGLYTSLPPNSSSNGVSLYIGDWDGLILEFPFSAFPVSMTAAQNLTLDVARNPPGASFEIRSITTAAPPLAGDYDRSGVVDSADYDVWRRFMGISTKNGIGFAIASADGNSDGFVNGTDYLIWRKAFDAAAAVGGVSSVPEPATFLMAVAAFFAVTSFRARIYR